MKRGELQKAAGSGFMAILLYVTGFLSWFSLVPLQAYYRKGKEQSYLVLNLVVFLILSLRHGIPLGSGGITIGEGLWWMESGILFLGIGGLVLINLWPFKPLRRLYRTGIVAVTASLALLPVLEQSHVQQRFVAEAVHITTLLDQAGAELGLLQGTETLFELMYQGMVSSVMVFYFVFLSGTMWLAQNFRSRSRIRQGYQIKSYRLPELAVWSLIIPWLGLLMIVGLDFVNITSPDWIFHLTLNFALLSLVVFGIQGVAIAVYWLDQAGAGPFIRLALRTLLIVLFFMPGPNLILLILPLVGVSETWINYRDPRRS